MKTPHEFNRHVKAFFDTIGYKMPRITNQYRLAEYWTRNQEKIVVHIHEYCEGNEIIAAWHLRCFTKISISAKYLAEFYARNAEEL